MNVAKPAMNVAKPATFLSLSLEACQSVSVCLYFTGTSRRSYANGMSVAVSVHSNDLQAASAGVYHS